MVRDGSSFLADQRRHGRLTTAATLVDSADCSYNRCVSKSDFTFSRPEMSDDITVKQIESPADLAIARTIRDQVFIDEQGIPAELEHDELDAESLHVLAYRGPTAVATARLTLNTDKEAVLARVAVLPECRGAGLGQVVVRKIEELGAAAGVRSISLHPHHYLERFYSELGYHTVSGAMQVGEHRLIKMAKDL